MRSVLAKVIAFVAVLGIVSGSAFGETLTLDNCIEMALKNRANIIRARGDAKIAGATQLRDLGQFLPRLDARYERSKGTQYDIFSSIPGDTVSRQEFGPDKVLNLSGSVDIVNVSTWFNYLGSRAGNSAANLAAINSEQELILAVKTAYYNYLRALQNQTVNEQAVERSKEQLKLVESRYELGSAAYSDVLGQRVQYGNDQLEFLRAKNSATTSKAVLSYTIGMDPYREVEFETVEDVREYQGTMEEAISFGLDHEPGYLAAQADVKASKHSVNSAVANYIPTLSFNGSYTDFNGTQGYPNVFERSYKSKSFGFQVTYNIFDGFGRQRNITAAKVNRNNLMADLSDARNLVVQEIKTAFLEIQNQKEALGVAQEAVVAAEENMKITQERYNLGAATILDLLQAQEDLKRAQVASINERFSLNLSIANLENAMGKP